MTGSFSVLLQGAVMLALAMALVAIFYFRMNARLRKSEEILRENARHLEEIIAISPVPMIVVDPKTGRILFKNAPASARFPITEDADEQASAKRMFDTATGVRFFQLLKENRPIENFEALLQTNSGENSWVALASVPMDYAGTAAALITAYDINSLKRAEADLTHLAVTDSLTQVFNRRHFLDMSTKELIRAKRYNNPLSVIVMDLDRFKAINDTHGHTAGDAVLKTFSRVCIGPLRANDILGRIGGEEFAVTLPEANLESAYEVAERLRQAIESITINAAGVAINCTVSAGVAQFSDADETIDDVLRRADRALYRAKDAGRNRVMAA